MVIRKFIDIGVLLLILFGIFVLCYSVYAAVVEPENLRTMPRYRMKPITGVVLLRADAELTNAYVDTNVSRIDHFKNIAIALDITQGVLTSVEYIVWWSKDGVNWYREVTESVAAGVITHTPAYYTLALTGDIEVFAPVPFYANWFKLQIKGTGTVTGSLCSVAIFGSY